MSKTNTEIHIYSVDKTINMLPIYHKPDAVTNTHNAEMFQDFKEFDTIYQGLVLKINLSGDEKNYLIKNLENTVSNLRKIYPNTTLNVILPSFSAIEIIKNHKILAGAITDILTFSQNEDFRKKSFQSLNSTSSGNTRITLEEKLSVISLNNNKQNKQKQ